MCTALSGVVPGASVESVQTNTESPFRARREVIADRSSTMCTALSTVVCTSRGSSVKPVATPVKVAVTACAALIVTVQVPVPVQLPPLQPLKVDPAAGAAVRVTAVPLANAAAQVVPQETPAGALVIVPVPAPLGLTVSVKVCTAKVAVTVVAAPRVTVQEPVPVQPPPLQPLKMEPAAGAAVKETAVPLANAAAQVVPQETPAGELVIVPVPAPLGLTVSVKDCRAKVAVTV